MLTSRRSTNVGQNIDAAPIFAQQIGGNPASAGYQWDASRLGWYRPFDPINSFVPWQDAPDWYSYIPGGVPITPAEDTTSTISTLLNAMIPLMIVMMMMGMMGGMMRKMQF